MRRYAAARGVSVINKTSRSAKKVLTVLGVEKAATRTTRYELGDASLPNFYLSVMPSGHKSFVLRYRFNGKPRKLTIGSHPGITLQAARKVARDALCRVAMGNDPAGEKAAARKAKEPSSIPFTVDDLIDKFLDRHVKRNCRASTAGAYERMLKKDVLPAWTGRTLESIKRADVRALVEEIAEDRPTLGNRVLSTLSSMFAWAVEKEFITASPTIGLKKPTPENKRERALSDAELRLVLDAADKLPGAGRDFVRLLALTMQRRNEVAQMEWKEIDWDAHVWTIPAGRAKNGREHRVPLSDAAMAILKARAKDEAGSPHVFTLGSFGRLKEAIDALVAEANGGSIPHWTLHDLRRTGASIMPRLREPGATVGVSLPVIERILNHVSGSFAGIVAVYQRYNYEPEMRQAMEALANHLDNIRADNNVIQLRRA
jgi:integrase